MENAAFFVPDPDLLIFERPIPYSLYINSSALESRQHFVRIVAKGDVISASDFKKLVEKYTQVYLQEKERAFYLDEACRKYGTTESGTVQILKKSAVQHLDSLFDLKTALLPAEIINQTLASARVTVERFVDVVQNKSLSDLHELIGSLSFHDHYTYDHSIHVSMYCILLFQLIHPEADRHQIVQAGMGGFFHDVGKIRISNRIINKVGKLSAQEFREIQKHPQYGREYLSSDKIKGTPEVEIDLIKEIVYQHHENFDGTGYPDRIAGEKINELARITAIADFFDAITTKRSYSEALPVAEAINLMRKTRGKKLDPRLFDQFAEHVLKYYDEKFCLLHVDTDFDPCQPHFKLPKKPT